MDEPGHIFFPRRSFAIFAFLPCFDLHRGQAGMFFTAAIHGKMFPQNLQVNVSSRTTLLYHVFGSNFKEEVSRVPFLFI